MNSKLTIITAMMIHNQSRAIYINGHAKNPNSMTFSSKPLCQQN